MSLSLITERKEKESTWKPFLVRYKIGLQSSALCENFFSENIADTTTHYHHFTSPYCYNYNEHIAQYKTKFANVLVTSSDFEITEEIGEGIFDPFFL